jgi:hypothetical protein
MTADSESLLNSRDSFELSPDDDPNLELTSDPRYFPVVIEFMELVTPPPALDWEFIECKELESSRLLEEPVDILRRNRGRGFLFLELLFLDKYASSFEDEEEPLPPLAEVLLCKLLLL